MGSGAENETEKSLRKSPPKKKTPKSRNERNYSQKEAYSPDNPGLMAKVEPSPPLEGTVAVTDYTVAADLQDLDDKIKSMMEVSENRAGGSQKGFNRICKVCGKEGPVNLIIPHIESHHITGVSHTCNICGKTSRSGNGLRQHMAINHTKTA